MSVATEIPTTPIAHRRWKPYANYRPTPVPWLGLVPDHWNIKRLKYSVRLINEKTEDSAGLPYIGLEHIESWTGRYLESEIPVHPDGISNRFATDDVLFGKLRPYLAKVLHSRIAGVCTSEALVLRPQLLISAFLFFWLLNRDLISVVDGSTYGSKMPRANWEFIGNLPTLIPPPHEQIAIAAFLDRETARIDALIAKKQRLIELLQEKRTALISHTVTKGLDPNAPMKPSGVDWLGDVPGHWEAVRLRFLCDITTGERDTQDAEAEGGYPFFVRSDTVERISTWSFDGEGVLTSGDGVGVGKVFHHYIGKMEIHQRVYLFHKFRRIAGRFLFHFLRQNLYKVVLEGGAKSTVDSLRRPMLQNFAIAIPPLEEQLKIVKFIDAEEARITALKVMIVEAIDRLREYRSALISAAVTGKIDVRGEVS